MNSDFKVDYIGIGMRRSGTTWTQRCLKEHPQICASKNKELAFLNDPIKYKQGISAYAACFPDCKEGQIRGEYTPGYFASEDAIKMIKQWFPKAKLLVSFRNPIERAFDHYIFHKCEEKTAAKTFEDAIKDKALKPYYVDTGFYYSQFKKWLDVFPREQFLVLIYEDLKKDPVKFIQEVYRFLGVDATFIPPSIHTQVNWASKNAVKIPFLSLAIVKLKRFLFQHPKTFRPFVLTARRLKLNRLLETVRQANYRKKGRTRLEMPPIPEKTRRYLRDIYRDEIKKLGDLINRDLSFWQ